MHGIESTARRMLDKGAPLSCGQDQDQESSPDLDPLGIAARSGNDSVVRLLLERRANPNADYGYPYTCSTPKTPLSQAIKGGNESTARILLDHGAESDFSQHPNDLASELAYEGDIDGIKFLGKMQCGFEFIDKFGDGDRPLVQAINGGHVDVVQYLLEIAGVNPNNLARKPVICYAAYQKNPMVVVCLLKNGADMDHSILDDSPLELAMRKRHMRVVSVLLKYMDMGKLHSSEQYMLPCAAAAACGSESRVHDLIDRGCHLDENEFDGGASFRIKCSSRALAWAAEMGHEKIVLQLLSNGADPHTQADNSCRQTKPLIAAIDGDHLHIAKLLLDEGVDPNTFDKNNYDRPLSAAVRRSRVDIVELLLESGAEPNVKGRPWPYEEALLTAVNEGHEKISMLFLDKAIHIEAIFRKLLEKGANMVNRRGEPVLLKAIKWGKVAQVQMLLDHGDELRFHGQEEVLLSAGAEGEGAMLELLFQYGLEEPHHESKEAVSMITAAIRGQSASGLKFLLDRGYRILQGDHLSHIRDSWKYVCDNYVPSKAVLDVLLSHGLDINATGRHGRTCLWEVIDNMKIYMLVVLLERGANPLHRDRDGETPLMHAMSQDHDDDEIMLLIKSISTTHTGLSHNELRREVSRAEFEAAAQGRWKIVRVLQRFYYWDLGCGM